MKTKADFLLVLLLLLFNGVAQAAEFKKEFDKSYTVKPDARLELKTSFSNTTIEHWEQNEISVHIEVIADASTQENADRIFNKMTVDLTGNSTMVSIHTDTGNQDGKDGKFEMRIIIKAPGSVELNLSNSFGNISLSDFTGKASIDLDYGNLSASALMHTSNEVLISFGTGNIERLGGGTVRCDFGSAFISELFQNAKLESDYGELQVKKVHASCTDLHLDAEFGNVSIHLDKGASFSIDASASMGDIKTSGAFQSENSSSGWGSSTLTGKIGTGHGKLVARSSFGNISISAD